MRAGREALRGFALVTMKRISINTLGMRITLGEKSTLWDKSSPMLGASMICTGASGSGPMIGMTSTLLGPLLTPRGLLQESTGCFGAVRGTTIPSARAQLIASKAILTSATFSSAFVLPRPCSYCIILNPFTPRFWLGLALPGVRDKSQWRKRKVPIPSP
jgi:hypothetical protein